METLQSLLTAKRDAYEATDDSRGDARLGAARDLYHVLEACVGMCESPDAVSRNDAERALAAVGGVPSAVAMLARLLNVFVDAADEPLAYRAATYALPTAMALRYGRKPPLPAFGSSRSVLHVSGDVEGPVDVDVPQPVR
jgi:hypothetical protein